MNIVQYTHEPEHISAYCDFIKNHYADDPRINQHCITVKQQLSEDNPFYTCGKIASFLAMEKLVKGHITAIVDKRNNDTGLIGFYDCVDNQNISETLLVSAITWLKKNNCKKIQGPVNLSIWHNYRFIVEQKNGPELFDPFNKPYYITQWEKFGFTIAEKFVSATRTDFNHVLPYTEKAFNELPKKGFSLRTFDTSKPLEEMNTIRQLANNIFKESWNFVELSAQEFNSIYERILPIIDPHFIEIVEKEGKAIGFCFSMPHPNKERIMLKTIGVLKEYQRNNIGAALLHSQHLKAKKFKEFYYPLIRVGNNVTKLPFGGYEVITKYHTYLLKEQLL